MFYERLGKATLVAAMILGLIYVISLIKGTSHTTPAAAVAMIKPTRPTMDTSLQELIERYNSYAQTITQGAMRIPDDIKETSRNGNWHLFQTVVHPTVAITIEANNDNNRPFSLGFMATPDTDERVLGMTTVMTMIGATVFGKGNSAGALLRTCTLAANSEGKEASTVEQGYNVYCAVAAGAWIGGIAVPKSPP